MKLSFPAEGSWLEAVDSSVMSVDALATAAEGGVQSVAAVLFVAGVVI